MLTGLKPQPLLILLKSVLSTLISYVAIYVKSIYFVVQVHVGWALNVQHTFINNPFIHSFIHSSGLTCQWEKECIIK